MEEDSIKYDSLPQRPLPRWLTDQKEGLTTYKPPEINIKEDHSLQISIMATGLLVLIIVVAASAYIRKKNRNHSK